MKRKRGHEEGSTAVATTGTSKSQEDNSAMDAVEQEEQDSEVEADINPDGSVDRMTGESVEHVMTSVHDVRDYFPEPPCWKYDVFLSFQGEGPSGTRYNFTDVLYYALCSKGLETFKDDEKLEQGRLIGDDLMMAIEDSALFIVVFSKDYASSKWCLDELAKIMECSRNRGKSSSSSSSKVFVLPVFHEVDPKDVRKQKGSFEESFLRHERDDNIGKEKVFKWKSAMEYAGSLSGWVTRGRRWAEVADEIAQRVFDKTDHQWSKLSKDLVGLDSRVQFILTHLIEDSVCFFGICGMGGIGKTTLADAVHKRIRHCFEESIFLPNIRETSNKDGLVSLQKRLISKLLKIANIHLDKESDGVRRIRRLRRKKVLIILDDVDNSKQLEALAGSCKWFGMGSKVIITTRDKRLLAEHGAITYMLQELDDNNARMLFCRKAFRSDSPPEVYAELSQQFIDYGKGLPLALEVLGSSLSQRSKDEWQSTLSRLAKIPEKMVTRALRISFDGLDETAKEVFLCIACFFKGKSECRTLYILSSFCGFDLEDVISLLKERSLVKESKEESKEKLWMHDLIQEMGWEIVRQESPHNPGNRSLLWDSKDIYRVLKFNTATDSIRGIVFDSPMTTFGPLSAQAFSQMTNLRLLILCDVPFYDNLAYLSNELRFLKWEGFPSHSLPTSFNAIDLVELNLPHSHLKEIWCGTKNFEHLKKIKLSHSKSLRKTPDFTGSPHLQKIILEGCVQLEEIDESIGTLKKLTLLNLKDCRRLKVIPDSICDLRSLKFLNLSCCSSLVMLPRNLGLLTCLEVLEVSKTRMEESSASWLPYFRFWDPRSYRNSSVFGVPPLSGLTSLTHLELSSCSLSNAAILDDICLLHSLEKLNLSGNMFVEFPPCFTQLTKLKVVELEQCKSLRYLPTLPSTVEQVNADGCTSLVSLPDQLTMHAAYESCLSFLSCRNVVRSYGSSDRLAKVLLENYIGPLKLQHVSEYDRTFLVMFLPGNSIPEWIGNQSEGPSLSINLPDSSLQDAWNGLIMCCAFTVNKHRDAGTNNRGDEVDKVGTSNYRMCDYSTRKICIGFTQDDGDYWSRTVFNYDIKKSHLLHDHICLIYIPRELRLQGGERRIDDCKRLNFCFEAVDHVIIKSCAADLWSEQQIRPTSACEITQLD